jgi:hypothetical protein
LTALADSIRRLRIRRLLWLTPLLAFAAGYASGHHAARSGDSATSVPGSAVVLEYPARWHAAQTPAALAAAELSHAIVLAPNGDASSGGLLAAAVTNQVYPLPATVLSRFREQPEGEVIWLVSAPAYRYANVSISGAQMQATAYSLPLRGGGFTLALCFSRSGEESIRRRCEQIVESSSSPEAEAGTLADLEPQPRYARQLSVALTALQRVRSKARAAMSGSAAEGFVLASEARRLALGFKDTQLTLQSMSAPAAATSAATALERSMGSAEVAYAALASAAESGEAAGFLAARERVEQAEAGLHSALVSFGLLGYRVA